MTATKLDVTGFSIYDADWPGVIARLPGDWRLIRDRDGKRYHVQRRADAPEGEVWVAPAKHKAKTRAALLSMCPHIEGLAEACEGLPEDPAEALPAYQAALDDCSERFARNDWRREDYGRVIVRDGNLRLVVEPSGETYRLQWHSTKIHGPCDHWRTIKIADRLSSIREKVEAEVFAIEGEDVPPCLDLVRAMDDLPEVAADGSWPKLPKRPATVGDRRSEAE